MLSPFWRWVIIKEAQILTLFAFWVGRRLAGHVKVLHEDLKARGFDA